MRAQFSRPILWVALAGIGIILAFAGAFGTADALRPIPLAIYWMVVVVLTYSTGTLVHAVLRHRFARSSLFSRILCIGVVIGVSVSLVIAAINAVVFGPVFNSWKGWAGFFGTVIFVAFVVNSLLELVQRELARNSPGEPAAPAILDRIPVEKRGALVALSVEDHYVRVRTTKGEEMILMRLTDAIRETAPIEGLRVHRSHWVVKDQVFAVKRIGDRALLNMRHGPDVPVSRSNVPALRKAGFLPR